jgi:hypothetical protein
MRAVHDGELRADKPHGRLCIAREALLLWMQSRDGRRRPAGLNAVASATKFAREVVAHEQRRGT